MTEAGPELAVDTVMGPTAKEGAVPAYRLYALDAMGRVVETRDVAAEDDAAAEQLATRLLAEMPLVHAVEAWVRPRLVTRIAARKSDTAPSTILSNPRQKR